MDGSMNMAAVVAARAVIQQNVPGCDSRMDSRLRGNDVDEGERVKRGTGTVNA
jgi:hypothetical protein